MGHHLRARTVGLGTGGAPLVTQASANFAVGDNPWLGRSFDTQISQQSSFSGAQLDTFVNNGAGSATFGQAGSGLVNANVVFIPSVFDRVALNALTVPGGRSQFSQLQGVSSSGSTCAMGPMVMSPNPNDDNGYILVLQRAAGPTFPLQLFRGLSSTVIINAAVGTWANNDILRIEVDPGVAANTIRCYKNGVLQSTDVDNNALRPQAGGVPGICYYNSSAVGGTITFTAWSGGLL